MGMSMVFLNRVDSNTYNALKGKCVTPGHWDCGWTSISIIVKDVLNDVLIRG